MARNRYIFNNGEFGNLSTTFSRNVATVDDFAQAVSANMPRYGRAQAISDYASWQTALTSQQDFLGAGKSADGQHDLICYVLLNEKIFKIVRDHNFDSVLFSRDVNRTDKGAGFEKNDIFKGTSDLETNRAWSPRFGVVCHGLLVLRCDVWDWNGSAWHLTGTGSISFAIDATNGTLTKLRRDYIADPTSGWLDHNHGNYWCMTGYTPDPHYTDPPLAAWFAVTDYAGNPGSPGGYAHVMRATRSSLSSPWVPEQPVMIHSQVFLELAGNPADGNKVTITDIDGTTQYIFEFDDNSNAGGHISVTIGASATASVNNLITAINANLPANGMTRAVKDASTDAAIIQGVASVTGEGSNITFPPWGRHFHSAVLQVKSSTVIDVLISLGDAEGNQSIVVRCTNKASYTNPANWTIYNHGIDGQVNQWAGGVLGPDDNHIVGADLTFETIISAKTPNTSSNPGTTLASLDYLFGIGPSPSYWTENLWAHTDCPEKRRNYVSRSMGGGGTPPPDRAVCFSPDGRAWCMIADMPNVGIPFISGDRIYFDGDGLLYKPIPKARISMPMRLGPGGKQWVKSSNWIITGTELNITPTFLLKGSNGKWRDDGVDLPSQPPTKGRVIKVVNTGTNSTEGNNYIAGIGDPSVGTVDSPQPDNGKIFVRWWGMPVKGRLIAIHPLLDSGIGQTGEATQFCACSGTFTPHILTAVIDNANGANYGRWVVQYGVDHNENYYFASDLFVTGENPVPGYPMPEVRNTTEPDEHLIVGGLNLGSRWAVAVYAIIPWDSWDSVYPLVTEVPLWTLYSDSSNFVSVVADIEHDKLVFRVNGSSNSIELNSVKFWRCHPVVVCISRTNNGIEVSARVLGDIKTGSTSSAPTVNSGTQIRFGSPDWSRGTALDIADINIDTSNGLDATGRAALMADAAVELKLVSASYDPDGGPEGEPVLTLEFSRAIDPSGFVDEAYAVTDFQFNHRWYWLTGQPTMSNSNKTVQFLLSEIEPVSGSGVHLYASAESNGIVAVDDGEPWLGVSDLLLPFP